MENRNTYVFFFFFYNKLVLVQNKMYVANVVLEIRSFQKYTQMQPRSTTRVLII